MLPSNENLRRWYNINKQLPMNKLNLFWLRWEKNKLFKRRLFKTNNMKSLLLITAFLLASILSYSQTIKRDSVTGNYYAVKNSRTDSVKVNETGLVFTDLNGVKYPIYKSAKGKLFYYRTSKAGNIYKVYIKTETP